MRDEVLLLSLQVAVPLRIRELVGSRIRHAYMQQWADQACDEIAAHGDILQFGGKRGEVADVFNHLARGLAVLALLPGGVAFAGTHWCGEHVYGVPADAAAHP
jgi:hypothetical protein